MAERRRRFIVIIILALIAIGGSAFNATQSSPSTTSPAPDRQATNPTSSLASDRLETLAIKGRAPKTGYTREQFGAGWADIGGCDMRNFILKRDMTSVVTKSDTDCTVESGVLNDPYTGKTISFTRGAETSSAVQIDHVVALSDDWQKGAQNWDVSKRTQLYNDPLNLLAVDGPTNTKKGDGDAATWLPPNKDYRCQYVARQVAVKSKYGLWVTQAEHDAIAKVLQTCPDQVLPEVS